MNKKGLLVILVLFTLFTISACEIGENLEFQKYTPSCCVIKSSNTKDFLGCIAINTQAECFGLAEKGFDVNYYSGIYCNEIQTGEEVNIVTPVYQCNDGIDNDEDGLIDYSNDSGCSSLQDNNEMEIYYGDGNCDGVVDPTDRTIIKKIIAGMSVTECCIENCMNLDMFYINGTIIPGDNIIDPTDLTILGQMISGQIVDKELYIETEEPIIEQQSEGNFLCSYDSNDCFALDPLTNIIYYVENEVSGCSPNEEKIYKCEYNETEGKATLDLIKECDTNEICKNSECVLISQQIVSIGSSGGSSGGSGGRSSSANPIVRNAATQKKEILTTLESCNNNGICEISYENSNDCVDCRLYKPFSETLGKESKFRFLPYIIALVILTISIIVSYSIIKFKKNGNLKKNNEKRKKK